MKNEGIKRDCTMKIKCEDMDGLMGGLNPWKVEVTLWELGVHQQKIGTYENLRVTCFWITGLYILDAVRIYGGLNTGIFSIIRIIGTWRKPVGYLLVSSNWMGT
jgi:hypothetical protein